MYIKLTGGFIWDYFQQRIDPRFSSENLCQQRVNGDGGALSLSVGLSLNMNITFIRSRTWRSKWSTWPAWRNPLWRECVCPPTPCWRLCWAPNIRSTWTWGPTWSRSRRRWRRRWVSTGGRSDRYERQEEVDGLLLTVNSLCLAAFGGGRRLA